MSQNRNKTGVSFLDVGNARDFSIKRFCFGNNVKFLVKNVKKIRE